MKHSVHAEILVGELYIHSPIQQTIQACIYVEVMIVSNQRTGTDIQQRN